jgi:hypothetical protein
VTSRALCATIPPPLNDDVPYWRLNVSYGSSGLVRDFRSEAKPGHKHTLEALDTPWRGALPTLATPPALQPRNRPSSMPPPIDGSAELKGPRKL